MEDGIWNGHNSRRGETRVEGCVSVDDEHERADEVARSRIREF